MSTQPSPSRKANERQSFAAEVQARFSKGPTDHVGAVKHFEAVELSTLVTVIRDLVAARGLRYQDRVEEIRERLLYNGVAELPSSGDMNLWILSEERQGVGVLVEAKLFHPTERSAEADEYLAEFFRELEERLLKMESPK